MSEALFVEYYRVSTERQGRSGLGLAAQRADVARCIAQLGGGRTLAEKEDIASGKRDDRKALTEALDLCADTGASLVFAKFDRLTRDLGFWCQLKKSGVNFIAAENPNATPLTIDILIAFATEERRLIGERTKKALAAKKAELEAKGERLGNPLGAKAFGTRRGAGAAEGRTQKADAFARRLAGRVLPLRAKGLSYRAIADDLNDKHILTPNSKKDDPRTWKTWKATTVKNLLARIERIKAGA